MQKNQHSPEFIEQALSKVRTRGSRTLESVATELNMPLGTLKGWLKRSRPVGAALADAPTLPTDTVFARSAVEPWPSATAPCADRR